MPPKLYFLIALVLGASTLFSQERASAESAVPRALLLMEALIYQFDEAVLRDAEELLSTYLSEWPARSSTEKAAREHKIKELHRALEFLETHGLVPSGYPLGNEIEAIARNNGWIRK